ncbi:MAG: class II aldolase/adducin family protein [Nitrospirae bacterium]|nr:class II aldolase/adducin family protein [Nitrospirota bacterium]
MNKKVYGVNKIKALIIKHSKRAFSLGLVWGKSGNISIRADADSFFITATGKGLGDITGKDLVLCRTDKDSGNKNASMEWRLHSEIYRNRRDACAVFHSQPLYSTLIACATDKKIKTALIPETIAYFEKIEVVPYCHAGSIELAKKCGEGAKKADVLLLENHGVVTFGLCIEDAVNKTLTFEFLCRLNVLSKAANIELKEINPGQVREFLNMMGAGKRA